MHLKQIKDNFFLIFYSINFKAQVTIFSEYEYLGIFETVLNLPVVSSVYKSNKVVFISNSYTFPIWRPAYIYILPFLIQ